MERSTAAQAVKPATDSGRSPPCAARSVKSGEGLASARPSSRNAVRQQQQPPHDLAICVAVVAQRPQVRQFVGAAVDDGHDVVDLGCGSTAELAAVSVAATAPGKRPFLARAVG